MKNKKFSKENNVFPKNRHVSPREMGMNDPLRRKIPQRFIVPPIISPVQEWLVVQHKKFPQNPKKENVETKSYREKTTSWRNVAGKTKRGREY